MRWNFPKYKISSVDETIELILRNKLSITRFGDGEFDLMLKNKSLAFQKSDSILSEKLRKTLNSRNPKLLVCIPDSFSSMKTHAKFAREFWIAYINSNGKALSKILDTNYHYGNANISRLYIFMKNKKKSKEHFQKIKNIWRSKDILIIEGKFSRLGVGNDLFSDVNSLQRIVCPPVDAFKKYDSILDAATKFGENKLILLALGPTATVLSSELCDKGYWVIDIGHIDIEYMWMLMGVDRKVPIKGKFVNESLNNLGYEMGQNDSITYNNSVVVNLCN